MGKRNQHMIIHEPTTPNSQNTKPKEVWKKMDIYEAFQQTLSVPLKEGIKLVPCKCRNVANVAMMVMMNRER